MISEQRMKDDILVAVGEVIEEDWVVMFKTHMFRTKN